MWGIGQFCKAKKKKTITQENELSLRKFTASFGSMR